MDKEALISILRIKAFSEEIINAFNHVKREEFIPDELIGYSYEDIALPTEHGSTISQPSVIAFMLSLLELEEDQKIMEIGSGSGYVLALISKIIKNGEIFGLEINQKLAISSTKKLSDDKKIRIIKRDGSFGLPHHAPFDRILISASCPDMRIPYNLAEQLKESGIMVAAVKQSLFQIKKINNKLIEKEFPGFTFIPLRKEE